MNERTFNGHTFDPDIINYPQVAASRVALFFLAALRTFHRGEPPMSLTCDSTSVSRFFEIGCVSDHLLRDVVNF